jgi:phosphate transport system permease protein
MAVSRGPRSPIVRPGFVRSQAQTIKENLIKGVCFLCAAISVATTLGIIGVLTTEAINFFRISGVSPWQFFTGTTWTPQFLNPQFGVLPLIMGTLQITLGAALIAVPLGLVAAIYLSEYADSRVRDIIKPILEILAGIPTVVYGYFALMHITPFLRQFIPGLEVFNGLSGALVVGIMILPLVSSLCEDALHAVPKSLREGAYGLGSTKLEVTLKIVVPAALSGIAASFILAISRAVGETMAVSMASGSTPNMTLDPRESIQTMTAFIVQISKGDTPAGSVTYLTLFAVGVTLFTITLLLNLLANKLVRKYRTVYN